jgi:hypothetical protein
VIGKGAKRISCFSSRVVIVMLFGGRRDVEESGATFIEGRAEEYERDCNMVDEDGGY